MTTSPQFLTCSINKTNASRNEQNKAIFQIWWVGFETIFEIQTLKYFNNTSRWGHVAVVASYFGYEDVHCPTSHVVTTDLGFA